jgi:type IV pilus assembly protein PilB
MDMGCVAQADIDRALEAQMNGNNKKIGELFVAENLCKPDDITAALAEQFGMEMVDLAGLEIDRQVLDMISQDTCRDNKVMPIDVFDGVLTVAVSDPLDIQALDNLRFVTNMQVEPVLATAEAIMKSLDRWFGLPEDQIGRQLADLSQSDIQVVDVEGIKKEADQVAADDDAPIIRLVQLLITDAVKSRASDIHIEPMIDRLRVRYRIDGNCYEVESPPKRLQGALISRIKIMARMKMEEKRRPQDGKIAIKLMGRSLDLRVSALPATHGESVVLRILDKQSMEFTLTGLGFYADDLDIFRRMIKKPNGIILITGPTGSGKTTTLYAAITEMNQTDRKIITAENPVEYTLAGVNQCDIRPEQGMTFQKALRAMLRQAPDIILVGEIRDKETAEIAIQAALTGHLVFSTLHTNDAPSALTRLIDMGIPPFLVASSIQAVIAQRLIRTVCPECREPEEPDLPKLRSLGLREEQLAGATFVRGRGCANCRKIGFKGRKGIFEIMTMNGRLREMCFQKATTDGLREQARRDGMHTLLDDGIRKVLAGWTVLEEVLCEAKQYV